MGDRPAMLKAIRLYTPPNMGKTPREKLTAIGKRWEKNGADALLVSSLDEIAWTLNIRGNDVHCNRSW